MKIEILEIILVILILTVQIVVFFRTYRQIGLFRKMIPFIDTIHIRKIYISQEELQNRSPKEILADLSKYQQNTVYQPETNAIEEAESFQEEAMEIFSAPNAFQPKEEIAILEPRESIHPVFENIRFSINNYLIRNHGAASDFNLIKDIIERHTDAIEEDINLTIGIPLYLGLMGTMLGIVIGLFNMPDLNNALSDHADILLNQGIGLLIGGVKIAMIASFVGLLLTIINSGWVFKGSRIYNEQRRNELYTFIQIELLPIINQGLAATLESLQRNLARFNTEFSGNLSGLQGVFDSGRHAVLEQKALLETIENAKISEIAKYNVHVLQQMEVSLAQFDKFNQHFAHITTFVEHSGNLVEKSNELLQRTDNFKQIAMHLENKLDQSEKLLDFLTTHFKNLQEYKELTSYAVAEVGHGVSDTFKELRLHIQNSSDVVKQFTVDEIEVLKTALSSTKTNLGNLEYLGALKHSVSELSESSQQRGSRLEKELEQLNGFMKKTVMLLDQMNRESLGYKTRGIGRWIGNLFKSKK